MMQDGVVCATDTALRDFSATCLKEFLKWSIKQASKKVGTLRGLSRIAALTDFLAGRSKK